MRFTLSALACALLAATSTQAAVFQSKQVKQLNGGNFKRLVNKSEVSDTLVEAIACARRVDLDSTCFLDAPPPPRSRALTRDRDSRLATVTTTALSLSRAETDDRGLCRAVVRVLQEARARV